MRRTGRSAKLSPENHRVIAELSADALLGNYDAISKQVPELGVIPMIKANAYGHDAGWVARVLAGREKLEGFGVATLQEGAEIREELGARNRRTPVIVFSGAAPWNDEKGYYCEEHGLTAVIASDQDWKDFFRTKWHERIPYQLKFNSGMNRLGISANLAPQISQALRKLPTENQPQGIMSHLAMAETPDSSVSLKQLELFKWLRGQFESALPQVSFHLANSSAIWNSKYWKIRELTDIARPGLSLYGVTPWAGAPERGLQPVMTLKARVVAVQKLKPGESIGYGATFTAKGKDPVYAAVLSAGYADGIHRILSNRGHVWLDGKATSFLGIVSMDLSAVLCSPQTKIGSWAEILGPNVDIWAQAKAASTIPYELLTSVSSRVQRVHV